VRIASGGEHAARFVHDPVHGRLGRDAAAVQADGVSRRVGRVSESCRSAVDGDAARADQVLGGAPGRNPRRREDLLQPLAAGTR
jgi:hypothetical protein